MIPLRAYSSYDSSHVQPWETEMYFILHPAILGVLLLFASAAIWSSGVAVAPGELQPPQGGPPPYWLSEMGGTLKREFLQEHTAVRNEYMAYVLGAYTDLRVTPPVVRFLVVANGEEKRRHFPPFECRFTFRPIGDPPETDDPVRASWSPVGHRGGFEPLLVTCPTPRNGSLPHLVSLVYMGTDGSGWIVPRQVERVAKRFGTIALCVTVGDEDVAGPNPRMLAEFLAFYDAVGVTRYVFYIKSPGAGLDYLTALQREYRETTNAKDRLRVHLDAEQQDDEAVTSCVYDLVPSSIEYALAVTPRDFVVPRRDATLKGFIQRNRGVGAMTFLRYSFVGPRPVSLGNESTMTSQLKVLRSSHADPPGMTSRALVKVADVVQLGARGGFSLLKPASARVVDPRLVSVHSYVEDCEISPEATLSYDDRVRAYGDFMRQSLAWRLYIERFGA
ncbi:uncharacterized protein LOC142574190 [Dermacentor variabilis]|uniref:uncharacterized protein LOC142574190 n=1 Tax=Dermacentor variabilis TaxID=34621 RepID=UPI003F5BF820